MTSLISDQKLFFFRRFLNNSAVDLAKFLLTIGLFAYILFRSFTWISLRPVDYLQFWAIGQAIEATHTQNIYAAKDRDRIGEYMWERSLQEGGVISERRAANWRKDRFTPAGTPFLYAIFKITATGNFNFDYRLFQILSFLAMFGSLYAAGRALGHSALFLGIFFVLLIKYFYPLQLDVYAANVNTLQIGLLSFGIWVKNRKSSIDAWYFSGLIIGFGFFFKPNITYAIGLIFFLWMLSEKKDFVIWFIGGLATMGAIALILPSLVLGEACTWKNWYTGFQPLVFKRMYFNKSFIGFLLDHHPLIYYKVFAGLLLIPPLLVTFQSRRRLAIAPQTWFREYILIWTGMAAYILSGPLIHGHYFVLMIPLALVAMRPKTRGEGMPIIRQAIGVVAIVLLAFHPQLIRMSVSFPRAYDLNIYSYLSTFALYVLAVWDYKKLCS